MSVSVLVFLKKKIISPPHSLESLLIIFLLPSNAVHQNYKSFFLCIYLEYIIIIHLANFDITFLYIFLIYNLVSRLNEPLEY